MNECIHGKISEIVIALEEHVVHAESFHFSNTCQVVHNGYSINVGERKGGKEGRGERG